MDEPTKPLTSTSDEALRSEGGQPTRAVATGELIDRYVVLSRLGEGGSGEVFAAFDPVLDRKVAVKVLRNEDVSGDALVREGRMLAKLSDPHVVTIHDVGLSDARAYLAMELLEGPSFDAWCAERRADGRWGEIVSALRSIGRGITAAHAAGIVHGDLKPSNVLVDEQDRVKVSDFGIARALEGGHAEEGGRASRLVGTPAFMSPEQHDLAFPDPRSDQYSFCLLGWVALTGRLPFEVGNTLEVEGTTGEIDPPVDAKLRTLAGTCFPSVEALAVAKQAPLDIASADRAPSNAVAVLRRGLSVSPEERWSSMAEVVDALATPEQGARKLVGVAVVAGLGAVAVAAAGQSKQDDPVCQGASEHLREVWDDDARGSAEAAFGSVDNPLARDTWPLVRERLDTYAQSWVDQHRDACEATSVRKEQSPEALDLRMSCLHQAKTALKMTGRVLADADEGVVEAAPKLVAGLPPLARCEDLEALRTEMPEPDDPQTVASLAATRERLAEVRALTLAGKEAKALQIALEVHEEAAAIGYVPLSVDVARFLAHLHLDEAQVEEAKSVAVQGLDQAIAAGAWQKAARLAVTLTSVSDRQEQTQAATVYAQLATSLANRPGADTSLRSRTLHAQAVAAHVNSRFEEALAKDLEALEVAETAYEPSNPQLAIVQSNLANRFANMGNFGGGMPYAEAAAATFATAYGPRHPQTLQARAKVAMLLARSGKLTEAETVLRETLALNLEMRPPEHYDVQLTRNTLANVLSLLGRHAEAEEQFRLDLAAQEKTKGLDTVSAAMTIASIATAQLEQGEVEEAVEGYARALEISKRNLPAGHSKLGGMHDNYGNALASLGRYEDAREQIEKGLAIYVADLGPDHLFLSNSHFNLAGVLASLKDSEGALVQFERAVAIREAALEDDNPSLALVRLGLGDYYLELGRIDDARPHLEKAWSVYADRELPAVERGRAAFAMARITEDRESARTLAERGLALLEEAGPVGDEFAEDVRAWLKAP